MRTTPIRTRLLHGALALVAAVGLSGCEAQVSAFLGGKSLAEILFEMMREDHFPQEPGDDTGGDDDGGQNNGGGGDGDSDDDDAGGGDEAPAGGPDARGEADDALRNPPDGRGWLALPASNWRIETMVAYEHAGDVVVELVLESAGRAGAARFRVPRSGWPVDVAPTRFAWDEEYGVTAPGHVKPMTFAPPLGVDADGMILAGRRLRLIPVQSHLAGESREGWRFLTGAVDVHVLPAKGLSTGSMARLHVELPVGR